MNLNPRPSLRPALDLKCKECVYDPDSRGTWREQVADCGGVSCPLYDIRPVPRDCVSSGIIDRSRIAAISAKLARSGTCPTGGIL